MSTLRDTILQADDLPTEEVYVEEWGVRVYVRTMTALERDRFDMTLLGEDDKPNMDNFRARVVTMCTVDENGERVFRDEDTVLVGNKSGLALDRVFDVAQRLNGLRNTDIEEAVEN